MTKKSSEIEDTVGITVVQRDGTRERVRESEI